jgi:hypothetical protein
VLAPTVAFSVDSGPLVAVAETAHRGVPLLTVLNRRNYRRFAFQGTDWLIDLAHTTRRDQSTSASRIARDVLDEFELNFGAVVEAAPLAEARRVLTRLEGLPLVCEHRDFSPWNLFVLPGRRLAVFDWESSEPEGLPLLDLIYFLTYMASALLGGNPADVIRAWHAAHDRHNLQGEVHHECLVRYVGGLRLDTGMVPALSLLTWMIHSRSEYRRMVADAGGQPSLEALRRSLFLQLWRTELGRQPRS